MAVVDSSVLIHLSRVGRLYLLKNLFKKVKITRDVYNEVITGKSGSSEIQKACEEWITISAPKDLNEINKISKLEDIEKADASIILLAKECNEILISNDYALIMTSKSKGIKCWWLTTFILQCLKKKIIKREESKQILLDLIKAGLRLDNEVYAAILKEIEKWKS